MAGKVNAPRRSRGLPGCDHPDPHSVGCKTQTRLTHSPAPQELVMTDGQPSEGSRETLPAAAPGFQDTQLCIFCIPIKLCLLF